MQDGQGDELLVGIIGVKVQSRCTGTSIIRPENLFRNCLGVGEREL